MEVYLILGGYLLLTLGSGFIGYGKSKRTPEDYFLASRGLGVMIVFFTFIATNFSAFFFLGFAGQGYHIGYAYYAMMAIGTAFAALSFYLVGTPAWILGKQHGAITAPELLGLLSGSRVLRWVTVIVMVLFTLPYMAIQPIGAGILVESLTGGTISYFQGCLILTGFIVLYVFAGGMRSVAITDMIQGVLMFLLIFAALFVVAAPYGGWMQANLEVFEVRPELFDRRGAGGYFSPLKWLSFMLLWICCVPMFPQMFMRFFVARKLSSLKISAVFYALVPALLFIAPVGIGVIGTLEYPGLQGKEADNILPMMLTAHAHPYLATLIMTGALAAFMSTLDSQLLALSTILTRDLRDRSRLPDLDTQVNHGKILVILLALVSLVIAWFRPAAIFTIVRMAFGGLAILFPAALVVLRWPDRVSGNMCALAIILGEGIFTLSFFGIVPWIAPWGLEPFMPGLLICSITVLVSACTGIAGQNRTGKAGGGA